MSDKACKFTLWGIEGQAEIKDGYVVKADEIVKEYIGYPWESLCEHITKNDGSYELVDKPEQTVRMISFTIDDYCYAIELAKSRGKKEGESFEKELLEICKRKGIEIKNLGKISDPEMLLANLRENGITKDKKILFLKNKKKKKDETDK